MGLNGRKFENNGDGRLDKAWKVLDETENVTATNRGYRTKNLYVATYEQTKKGLSHFDRKQKVEYAAFILSIELLSSLYTR